MDFDTFRLQAFAQALAQAFVRDNRTDGTEYVYLREGSPDWMTDVVHAAHGGMMPDDWRYRMIEECANALADREPDHWEDDVCEIADSLVDVYNSARLQWLSSHLSRAEYVDEARDEGLITSDADTFDQLGIGQYVEYREIIGQMIEALSDARDDVEPTADEFSAWCKAHRFMQPQVYAGEFYRVETSHGMEIVPADIIGRTVGTAVEAFANYVEGSIDDPNACVECESGYLARMSAPGFMDCTDWTAHDTATDAWKYLIENYVE